MPPPRLLIYNRSVARPFRCTLRTRTHQRAVCWTSMSETSESRSHLKRRRRKSWRMTRALFAGFSESRGSRKIKNLSTCYRFMSAQMKTTPNSIRSRLVRRRSWERYGKTLSGASTASIGTMMTLSSFLGKKSTLLTTSKSMPRLSRATIFTKNSMVSSPRQILHRVFLTPRNSSNT